MKTDFNDAVISQKIQEAAKIGWWKADMTKRMLIFSSYLVRLFGIESDEISFDTFKTLIYPDDREQTMTRCYNLLLYQDEQEEVIRLNTIYGYQPICIKPYILEHVDCNIIAEGYLQCLTLKEAIVKREKTQNFLNELFQNMPLGYTLIRLESTDEKHVTDFEYLDVNTRFLEIAQLNRDQLIHEKYSVIGTLFSREVDFQMLSEVAFQGKVAKENIQLKSNGHHYVNTLYSPQRGDVIILFEDVTETVDITNALKKSRKKLQKIYDNIPVGVEVYNKDGCMIDANEKAATMQGLFNKESLIGLNLFEHPFLPKYAYDLLMQGKDVTFNYRASREGNSQYYKLPVDNWIKYFTIKCSVLYNSNNQVENYIVIVIDNTEMYEINESLEKAKIKAEEADSLKSQFLSNMSHEIRTPLNAIIGFSELLADTEDQEEKDEFISIIKRNNELLLQLINDILDLSRIESNRLEFIYGDVNVNRMLRSLESSSNLRLKDNLGVNVIFNAPSTEYVIRTEENRVLQVLSNFVNNAIKFTQEGQIEIGYQIREKDVCFFVSDTGIGIPEDKQADIFKRFVKLNEYANGTGLGLSICLSIIQRLKGEIGVKSTEGVGSTFWFTLPVKPLEKLSVES